MAGKGWTKSVEIAWIAMGLFLWSLKEAEGVRFVIDREECLSHDVKFEGDTVHISFVVIKADSPWHFTDEGVDLVVLFFFPSNCRFFFFLKKKVLISFETMGFYSFFLSDRLVLFYVVQCSLY